MAIINNTLSTPSYPFESSLQNAFQHPSPTVIELQQIDKLGYSDPCRAILVVRRGRPFCVTFRGRAALWLANELVKVNSTDADTGQDRLRCVNSHGGYINRGDGNSRVIRSLCRCTPGDLLFVFLSMLLEKCVSPGTNEERTTSWEFGVDVNLRSFLHKRRDAVRSTECELVFTHKFKLFAFSGEYSKLPVSFQR